MTPRTKRRPRSTSTVEVTFRVHRAGLRPCIEFVPGPGIGSVDDLYPRERDALAEHVTSMMRDRTPRPAAAV